MNAGARKKVIINTTLNPVKTLYFTELVAIRFFSVKKSINATITKNRIEKIIPS